MFTSTSGRENEMILVDLEEYVDSRHAIFGRNFPCPAISEDLWYAAEAIY